MSISPDFKKLFISAVRARDVELSEDLFRRVGDCPTLATLTNYMHGLIAQYQGDTSHLRSCLLQTEDFDHWITSFNANILPYMIRYRLPSCTDRAAPAQYQCTSKDSIL